METKVITGRLGSVARKHMTLISILLLVAVLAVVNVMNPITLPGGGKEILSPAEPIPELVSARVSARVSVSGVPVVAKITDVDALKQEYPVIYKDANNGDYVLQYAELLVVYDYGNDVIVNQLPITRVSLDD